MDDIIVRASADNGHIRAFASYTRDTVEEARQRHNLSPVVTAALGRLLSAGAMMGTMLKGENDLMTLQVKCDGPVQGMTVTADAKGTVKGYALNPQVMLPVRESDRKLDVSRAVGKGFLRVISDMGLKEPYIGETELVTGEIAEDITYYFAQSQQTPSAVGLGVLINKDNIVEHAGGFIVQLMPDAPEKTIDRLEQNLGRINSVTDLYKEGKTPEDLLGILLEGLDMKVLESSDTGFKCDCSSARIEAALISIGKKELEELIDSGEEIEMGCQFCGKKYMVSNEKLKELYKEARAL